MTAQFPETGPVTLRTNLADYPVTRALRTLAVRSELVRFDFVGPKSANQGFKPMVRDGAYDAGELAIGTFLQAMTYGKPLVLLPAVVMGRFQHHMLVYNAARRTLAPKDLEGGRIAVRAYSQTTGIWIRGILQDDYGVDPANLRWLCPDDAHLAEYIDPPNVERIDPDGKPLEQLLMDGDADAAILAGPSPSPDIVPIIPNANDAARAWCWKHGTVPVNHYFAVSKSLVDQRPDVVQDVYRMLLESKKAAPPSTDGFDFHPFGLAANRKAVELFVRYAVEQSIIPWPFEIDEIFGAAETALGKR